MYQVSSATVFIFVSYMHIHVPFISIARGCLLLFDINCLHTFKHDVIHWVTSLQSFVFVSAAVSELCELNQNKEEKKN